MPKTKEREYRSMPVLAIQHREEGAAGASYIVEGYATTFEEPYVLYRDWNDKEISEVIDRHAFDGTDMSDVIMQFDHEGKPYARNKNGTMQLEVDEHGLKVRADLGTTERTRDLYEDIQAGLIDQMSFGFAIEEESYNKDTHTFRVMKIRKLYDVSAVSIPANPGTDISAKRQKDLDGVIEEERAERLAEEKRQEQLKLIQIRLKLKQ